MSFLNGFSTRRERSGRTTKRFISLPTWLRPKEVYFSQWVITSSIVHQPFPTPAHQTLAVDDYRSIRGYRRAALISWAF